MGLVARLFGRTSTTPQDRGYSRLQTSSRDQTRRELIAMAVRDTLKKHGLGSARITADAVPGIAGNRHAGMHIQLVLRAWEPALLSYVVGLQEAVRQRLLRLDPLSPSWVAGVSWRFEPDDAGRWPQLPTAGKWNAVAAAPAVPARRSTANLDKLLQSGDAAYGQRAAANSDFSPTLPMVSR